MAMELRALFLLPLCFPGLQGQTPEAQRLLEGNTLHIVCPYTAQTEYWHTKYWRLLTDRGYETVAQTSHGRSSQSNDRRTTIKDDPTKKTVSITMTDLKAEDSGTYIYAIYPNAHVPRRTISLNVFKELLKWELDTVSVQCPNRNGMAWCRREQTDCVVPVQRQTSSTQSAMESLQDRASVKYNSEGILAVTMEKLQSWDSGVYWCALGSERITDVMLSVSKKTQQRTAEESGNVSVQCHYKIKNYRAVSKAWCKKEEGETCKVLVTTSTKPPVGHSPAQEGVRIQDDTQQGIVTVTMEQLQVQDSGVYWCALQESSGLSRMEEITLKVSKGGSGGNTFLVLTVVLLILLLLALVTSAALGVRHYKLLGRTGNREAEDTSDRPEGTAQPGSTGRREGSQEDSKGPAYIHLDEQSHPSPEDPLYCNVEPSQAHRNPQHVEYAIIAFNQSPRSVRE
ncbi:hypothetical protein DUI87_24088 [Hirundo rustica rustica]|uniref:Ig-like domain-containing protein n=1 Tax=Hirundo rustica rustica TaxID=333673 RepID=A0A3M0JEG1_HIRRU|nr:hypothetical protein DUI87_24088 [Hirundo rustica rustica]